MRRKILVMIAAIAAVLILPLAVSAASVEDLELNKETGTITYCNRKAAGELVIPAEIDGVKVTSIGNYAFNGCDGLTSIDIPDGVTSIGYNTFADCDGLTSIHIPDSMTSIGDCAFDGCTGLTNIDIPDSVTSIGIYTFYNCDGLTSIHIPDNITSIGDCAFRGCTGLTSIDIPDGVTSIGGFAFAGCTGLTSIDIPDSVTSISIYVFYNCDGLTSINIPDSVTSIDDCTFRGCTGLTSIDIPDSVTRISWNAFNGCTGLTDVYYGGNEKQWKKIDIGDNNEPLTNATIHYNSAFMPLGISVKLNGVEISFDQPPVIEDNRTLVPLRAIFEALGATVDWDGDTQTVIAVKANITVSLKIGSLTMVKGTKTITLDVPAKIINERTLVPVRAIAEAFDCNVGWNADTREVIITE